MTRILAALGVQLSAAGVTLNAMGIASEHYMLKVQIAGLACQFVGGFIGHVTTPVQKAFARDAEKAVREQG